MTLSLFSTFSGIFSLLEDEYTLLETTNYNGYAFPARAVVKRLTPETYDPAQPARLFTHVLSEITVSSIGPFDGGGNALIPSQVMAYDFRPANLPKNVSVDYLVTDEAWKPPTDRQIQDLAEFAKKRANRDHQ